MSVKTCGSCEYFEVQKDPNTKATMINAVGSIPGVCHCMPPQVFGIMLPQGLGIQTAFPQPHSAMWCTAWQPRLAVETPPEATQ